MDHPGDMFPEVFNTPEMARASAEYFEKMRAVKPPPLKPQMIPEGGVRRQFNLRELFLAFIAISAIAGVCVQQYRLEQRATIRCVLIYTSQDGITKMQMEDGSIYVKEGWHK